MADCEQFLSGLCAAFPEPVLLLRKGAICYRNAAAAALFPNLEEGAPPPAALEQLLQAGSGMALLAAGGASWRASLQETEAGQLVMLRPADPPRSTAGRLALELRQQTAGISAAVQRLFPEGDLSREKRRQYLTLTNRGLYRLLRLVDHMELLDRPEGEGCRLAPMDLAGLCRGVADEVEDVCRGTGWRFTYDSGDASLITLGDDLLLRRMLMDLVSNAMKAVGAQGSFGLKLARLGERAALTVWDRGSGMTQEGLLGLFGPQQPEGARLDPSAGAGLGLAVVRRVAELHGGSLVVTSPQDKGFRAVVSLPVRRPEGGMPLRSGQHPYTVEHFATILMELADVLPLSMYTPEEE